ncbi:MAG TPA: GGDEF domain-containing protein [Gammaproteobacteria bacterium]|nr:GGDEF domain-containing protein [Gammaproteobacteria bacterium]
MLQSKWFRPGFRGRLFLVAFVCVHLPLLSLVIYLALENAWTLQTKVALGVTFLATLVGMLVLVWHLYRSTKPLRDITQDLQAYLKNHHLGGYEVRDSSELPALRDDLRKTLTLIEDHRQQLSTQATHDFLTGLFNRRIAEEHLDNNCKLAKRTGTPLCVALLDLDGFKDVNDSYGHDVGDGILREIAYCLRDSLRRESDWAARWGGDEFLLAVFAPPAEAKLLFEEIRHTIASKPLHVNNMGIHITVSIGVVPFTEADTPKDLLHWGDRLLYKAKSLGRNKVVFAD